MNAPIVIFAYKRKKHLERLIESLLTTNEQILESSVHIFADGPKNERDHESVLETRRYLQSVEESARFPSLQIYYSESNQGLARSIINGVDKILQKYGKVIVIEDDVVVRNDFLVYMNRALDFYDNIKQCWAIGALTVLGDQISKNNGIYITQRMSSYAWGTWKDRWKLIDWSVRDYSSFIFNPMKRFNFNRWGLDRASMLDDQMNRRIDSWAIRFEYSLWRHQGYVVFPYYSKAVNMGNDGSGTHSKQAGKQLFNTFECQEMVCYDEEPSYSAAIARQYRKTYFCSMQERVRRYLSNLFYRCFRKDKKQI